MSLVYKTKTGKCYQSSVEDFLASAEAKKYKGKINLIFTSPPFPLNRKKKYGNKQGLEYAEWLSDLSILFRDFLSPKGSIVIEVGNSWEKGLPVVSTLALESLLMFLKKGNLHLCQQFIWYNTAKLPSPAQWVNVDRIRVKDSFTHIWWMSKDPKPKANNKNILNEYSDSMKSLLKKGSYNFGARPSEHRIGRKSFLKENDGSIPSNVIIASNTTANSPYQLYCKEKKIVPHPARMPIEIPIFFIKFLTEKGDLVYDPFCGSNTTGEAAENLDRKWIGTELNKSYIKGSIGRFKGNVKL
jgi:DNA modification methylase